jgi:tight adherence protein B
MTFTIILIAGGAIVVVLLIVGIVVSINSESSLVEQRLGQYLEEDQETVDESVEQSVVSEWVNRRVERSTFGERIRRDLARADLKLKPAEYFSLFILSVAGGMVILGFLGRWHWVSMTLGAIVGLMAPQFYVKRQQGQRLKRFDGQLGDMLNLMVNGLRAGYSTMQAMEAVSKELPSPISDEFRRVVQEMQIGISMENALENLLRRIPSPDLDFVVTAINVQREVGGNLSEILDVISFTIRERVRIKGEIRVLTAQVRASGTLLSIVPVVLAVILWFLNPEYLMSFFDRGPVCGWSAIALIVFMIILGYFVMMRIADIEV